MAPSDNSYIPSLEELVLAAAKKGCYLEVQIWNDDYLEHKVAFPDPVVADEAASIVMEAINDVH